MYRKPAFLTVGSDSTCDIVLAAPGVAPLHARIEYDRGLVITSAPNAALKVNGVAAAAGGPMSIGGYEDVVELGAGQLDLFEPKLALLYTQPLRAVSKERPYVLGSDRTVADVLVDHPSVAEAHARIDLRDLTVTDLRGDRGVCIGERREGRLLVGPRLPPDQPVPFAGYEGLFVGDVWVPASVLRGEAWGRQAPASPRTVLMSMPPGATWKVGRSEKCQLRVSFAQVSQEHAQVTRRPDGQLVVRDLGSRNGTFVRGRRLAHGEEAVVPPTERVFIGPYPLRLDGASAHIELDASIDIEAVDVTVEVPDRRATKGRVTLLDRVSFKALPGDCIALMGPSGAGKTTLLTALLGGLPLSHGQVRVNGEDLSVIFDALRGSIGYVPQDDLIHPELKVWEAIRYSAKLRLPPDFTDAEIDERVDQTIRDLGLERSRDKVIGKPEKKTLSGGERKRVNIAIELVTDPTVLFLDEPTSGLAADDTASLILLLKRLAATKSRTIVATIHQPAREEYETFNLVLVLGVGGVVTYFGPTGPSSYAFFGRKGPELGLHRAVDNPRDMFDVMAARVRSLVASGLPEPEATRASARAWHDEFFATDNPVRATTYGGARVTSRPAAPAVRQRAAPWRGHQFMLLVRRYLTTKLRDRVALLVMLLQAPVIGACIMLAFHNEPQPDGAPGADPPACQFLVGKVESAAAEPCKKDALDGNCMALTNCSLARLVTPPTTVNDQTRAIYFLVIAAIWFGISNAAREIVSEQAIYRRERMVNLRITNYVGSKFVILALFGLVQCITLALFAYGGLGLSARPWVLVGFLFLATLCATACGLLISTLARSEQSAVAATPLALIPQILLGGGVVELTHATTVKALATVMPSRWAFEGTIGEERAHVSWPNPKLCAPWDPTAVGSQNKELSCAMEQVTNDTPGYRGLGFTTAEKPQVAGSVLAGMTLLLLGVVGVVLHRRGRN
jgi:ABC transport system ATP-binding/permease protein